VLLYRQKASRSVATYLSSSAALEALLLLLQCGTPRLQRICCRLLRYVSPAFISIVMFD
jgi:hypothetical protein